MSLFFQQQTNEDTRLGVWQITETEAFFGHILPQYEVRHPHKRLQHLAGRHLLTALFPRFPLEMVQVADTRKPFLPDDAFHFSISHCGDYAAAIVSKRLRVGIDIEEVTSRVARIREKFLHPEESAWVSEKGGDEDALLTLLWNIKEAVFKWWSYGQVDFSEQIRIPEFSPSDRGEAAVRFLAPGRSIALTLHYRQMGGLSLAWVAQDH